MDKSTLISEVNLLNLWQVSEQNIKVIESTIREVKESVPIYFTRMKPSHFFKVGKVSCRLPLGAIYNMTVLCVSAIGSANSFVQRVEKVLFSHFLYESSQLIGLPLSHPFILLLLFVY